MPTNTRPLSKSQFLKGLQCEKYLWLYRNRKNLIPEVSESQQHLFDEGHAIGRLAHQRFPGGVEITADFLHQEQALQQTKDVIAAGAKTLYEPAAIFDKVFIRADILNRNTDGTWDLVEVKGSTAVSEVYLYDLAIQRHVLEGAGFRIRRTILMHVNNEYVRNGAIDPDEFFLLADLTKEIKELLKGVPTQVRRFQRVAGLSAAPQIDIGPHCDAPYECVFKEHCWKHIPEYSIYDLVRLRKEKLLELKSRGVLEIRKVPDDFPLSAAQQLQVQCEKTKKVHIDTGAISELLDELVDPLYFLDFETLNLAIPPHDGLRPYQQMPFQASVHVLEKDGGRLTHLEYLGDGRSDPRPGLAEFLSQSIGRTGTVVAYNAGFEGQCLKALAAEHPRHSKALLSMADRLWDLGDPFRKCHYVHPEFRGSWSIKVVLPTLVPNMTYKNLAVSNGGEAQLAYLALMGNELKPAERVQMVANLKKYCGQDTLAMVKILEKLMALVGA